MKNMSQDNCQKIKLLKLTELLRQKTDEQNPMTTSAIIKSLGEMGISCDRRTLAKDIALLNEQGFEVMCCQVGKGNGYYIEDRSFSVPEIKILIDAVQAASFITDKKTNELISKIADLGGSHRASILKRNLVCFNTRKHSNESIYYNVDYLEDAICSQKKISFRYFDLGFDGGKVYRREGESYITEPVALIFNEDNYYLIAYSPKYGNTANYRVDRMDKVRVVDEELSEQALALREDVGQYTEQTVKMYSGECENITLEFNRSLVGAVFDRFGEGIKMSDSGSGKCTVTVSVQLSPTFWGWLFQFGEKMRILSPESAIDKYMNQLETVLNSSKQSAANSTN